MLAQRNAQLPTIGTCTECLTSAVMNDDGTCAECVARRAAYSEGLRQAALEVLYTAADNLVAGGWDLAQICEALHSRPECAVADLEPTAPRRIEIDEYDDGTPRRDWSRAAADEILKTVAPAARDAAARLGEDDPIGVELATLATRWSLVGQAHLSATAPTCP